MRRKRNHLDDPTEFDRVTDALASDLTAAAVHYQLYKDLRQAVGKYEREFNAAGTFWWLTLQAHLHQAVSSLARVYDQDQSAVSLRK